MRIPPNRWKKRKSDDFSQIRPEDLSGYQVVDVPISENKSMPLTLRKMNSVEIISIFQQIPQVITAQIAKANPPGKESKEGIDDVKKTYEIMQEVAKRTIVHYEDLCREIDKIDSKFRELTGGLPPAMAQFCFTWQLKEVTPVLRGIRGAAEAARYARKDRSNIGKVGDPAK
jgi:hypothetical protein